MTFKSIKDAPADPHGIKDFYENYRSPGRGLTGQQVVGAVLGAGGLLMEVFAAGEVVLKRLPEGKVEVRVDVVRIVVGHIKEWGNSGRVVGHA